MRGLGSGREKKLSGEEVDCQVMEGLGRQDSGCQITFKIKDGLYLGTCVEAFKDEEFVLLNWVENVVVFETQKQRFDQKLKELYNHKESEVDQQNDDGLKYMHCGPGVFDQQDFKTIKMTDQSKMCSQIPIPSFNQICTFIQSCVEKSTSCLIICGSTLPDIQTTGCIFTLSTGYMMWKYGWSMYKGFEYMNEKCPGVSISEECIGFLNRLEAELMENEGGVTYGWGEWKSEEELVVRNTFINASGEHLHREDKDSRTSLQSYTQQLPYTMNKSQNFPHPEICETTLQTQPSLSLSSTAPILKQGFLRDNIPTTQKRRRILFNLEQNTVVQFIPQRNDIIEADSTQQLHHIQVEKQRHPHNETKQDVLNVSRGRRISLCVSKIVAGYRQQRGRKDQTMVKDRGLRFDDCYEVNVRGLRRKSSFYNFQPVRKSISTKQKIRLKIQKEQILRIVKRLKTQSEVQTQQVDKGQIIGDQVIESKDVKEEGDWNVKQEMVQNKQSVTDRQVRRQVDRNTNQSWLSIIRGKRSQGQTLLISSQQKLKATEKMESSKVNNYRQDGKENPAKKFIKQMNRSVRSGLVERKGSSNERVQSRGKVIIEYGEFKEMVRRKQKSIGSLIEVNRQNKKDEKIVSLVEKIKLQTTGVVGEGVMKRSKQLAREKNKPLVKQAGRWR